MGLYVKLPGPEEKYRKMNTNIRVDLPGRMCLGQSLLEGEGMTALLHYWKVPRVPPKITRW